mgnify:CR=1 FL=1|tara:strand:+ start:661 stop:1041 length:381 start_codon:yes stop_codon:yes gene_type:complete
MTPEELNALADRVEGLEGSDLKTDILIEQACVPPTGQPKKWLALRYTGSIDAAMTLVGAMQLSKAGELWDGATKCGWATVHNYSNTERGMMWDDQHDVCAKTPALALTAAALRARAALASENSNAE